METPFTVGEHRISRLVLETPEAKMNFVLEASQVLVDSTDDQVKKCYWDTAICYQLDTDLDRKALLKEFSQVCLGELSHLLHSLT